MPLDFPSGPAINDTWTGSNGVSYTWNGTMWVVSGSGAGTAYVPIAGNVTMTGPLALYADPTTSPMAATKHYVDDSINLAGNYLGTWAVASNTPNISAGGSISNANYVATTSNPAVPETVPVGVPGIAGATVGNGDRIIWASGLGVWQILRNAGVTLSAADARYVALAGSTMTGALNLFGNSTAPTPAAGDNDTSIANTQFVQTAIAAAGVGQTFYYSLTGNADVAGYKRMLLQPSANAETTISQTCTGTGDFLLVNFITDPGVPGGITYPAGTAYRRLFGRVSAGTGRFHLQVYIRNVAGTETLVRDEFSGAFTNTTVALQEWLATPSSGGTMATTDRIVNRIYAQRVTGATNVTVTLYTEGTVNASQIQTTIPPTASAPVSVTAPLVMTSGNISIDMTQANNNAGRNLLHNALFNMAQRGVGPWTTNGAFTLDRWLLSLSLDAVSISQNAHNDTSRTQVGDESAAFVLANTFTGNAGAASFNRIVQSIEDVRRLAGKTVTVSLWAASGAGTPKLGIGFVQLFGTGGSPSAAVIIAGQSVTLSTTYTRYSLTFAIPSSSGKTLGTNRDDSTELSIWYSSGTTQATNAGNPGVQSGIVAIWGVQLEIGSVATPLAKRDPADELALCQRFYQAGVLQMNAYGSAGGGVACSSLFPVPMRATPTMAVSGTPTYANASAASFGADSNHAVLNFTATAAGMAVCIAGFTASADL